MIKVGIIGGAGYTAGELIRLLINHPDVEIIFVHSESNAGNKITDIHTGLFGETDLIFTNETPFDEIDLLFFCTAHGDTRKFIESHNLPEELRIIDLSTDYRLDAPGNDFIYGLPELNRKYIIRSKRVANPGCFATAIQLALLPLAKNLLLNNEIHVHESPDRQEPDKNRRRRLISVGATTIFPFINLSLINIWTKYARACPNCKTVSRLRSTLFRSEGISLGVFSLRCISTVLSK